MAANTASKPDDQLGLARPGNTDLLLIEQLEQAILRNAGGLERFKREIPLLLRKAIDEVIDSPRTNRFTLDDTKLSERIYLATKVRVQLRHRLKLARGKMLDLVVGETEAGIQSTINHSWSVPLRLVGNPCLFIKSDEKRATCSVGVTVIRDEELKAAGKSSRRRMISNAGVANIRWILKDEPLPDASS